MIRNRMWWACGLVILGCLQAWDSGVLRAGGAVQVLVALAIVVPPFALARSTHYGVQAAAVFVSFVLLTAARIVAPMPLNTLHLIAFMAALLIFGSKVLRPAA
jgi:hypothetical protein